MKRLRKTEVDFNRIYHYKKEDNVDFTLGGIRDTIQKHVNEIYTDIKNGDADYMAEIVVNINTWQIVDGQNRYTAILKAWRDGIDYDLEVRFRDIDPDKQTDVVKKINTTMYNWKKKDFVKMNIENGNESVERLITFCKTHDMCHGKFNKNGECKTNDRYGMSFLVGGNITQELLKDCTATISEEDVEFANEIHPEVMKIYKLCGYTTTAGWFETLIQGWYQFRSDARKQKPLEKMGGVDKYMERLEQMINTGVFNREQIQSKQVWFERFCSVLNADPIYTNKAA